MFLKFTLLAERFPLIKGILFLSQFLPLLLLVILFCLTFRRDFYQKVLIFGLLTLSLIISAGIITETIRFFYYSPRPFVTLNIPPLIAVSKSNSFPSRHVSFWFPVSLLIFFLNKRWGIFSFLIVFLMGLSRVAIGAHWIVDILGGFLVGGLGFWLALKILPKVYYKVIHSPAKV